MSPVRPKTSSPRSLGAIVATGALCLASLALPTQVCAKGAATPGKPAIKTGAPDPYAGFTVVPSTGAGTDTVDSNALVKGALVPAVAPATAQVPEPSSLALIGAGCGLALLLRRRKLA